MSTTPFNDYVAMTAYVPRNLIILLPDLEEDVGYTAQSENNREDSELSMLSLQARSIKTIFEMHVVRTRIKAVENQHRLLQNNVQQNYSQDFVCFERYGKALYHALRVWRDRRAANTLRIIMIEPDPTMTRVVDAWELVGQIDQIRNESVPTRDLSGEFLTVREGRLNITLDADDPQPTETVQRLMREHEKTRNHSPNARALHTTVSVVGTLTHTLDVMEVGQKLLDEMTAKGVPTRAPTPHEHTWKGIP